MKPSLSGKLTALSMVCLMLATTLASANVLPPTNTQLTTLSTNLSDIQSANDGSLYLTMKQIAGRLRTTAATIHNYADVAQQNGSLAQLRTTVLANKTAFFAPVDRGKLYNAWLLARKHGYTKNFRDFSEATLNSTQNRKTSAWAYLQKHSAHDGLIALAALYGKAADDLDTQAAEVKANGGKFRTAGFHWVEQEPVRMAPGDCGAADILATLYLLAGTFFPNPVTLGMWAIGTIWFGVRGMFC